MTPDERPRVLIVEDELLLVDALEHAVSQSGGDAIGCALTSGEAVQMASRDRPDLALVDVHLGDGPTGVDAARRLAGECGAVVLFMTANLKRLPDDYAGACGVMSKPYTDHSLRRALTYVMDCIRDGHAVRQPPNGLILSPAFAAQWAMPPATPERC